MSEWFFFAAVLAIRPVILTYDAIGISRLVYLERYVDSRPADVALLALLSFIFVVLGTPIFTVTWLLGYVPVAFKGLLIGAGVLFLVPPTLTVLMLEWRLQFVSKRKE